LADSFSQINRIVKQLALECREAVNRVFPLTFTLKREIEGIQELNTIYRNRKPHGHEDQVAHERRMVRLEEIMRQLAALRPK